MYIFFGNYTNLGIIHNEGELLEEQRRFTLRHLRDLGFGKTSSEALVQEEIRELVNEFRQEASSNAESSVDLTGAFNLSLINILWALIGGERFQRSDEHLKQLLNRIQMFIRSGNFARANIPIPGFLLRRFSFLRKFMGLRNDLFTPLQDFVKV